MDINELLRDGGTLSIERSNYKGQHGFKTTFLRFVEREDGDTEFRELGTLYTSTVKKALEYMPAMIEKYAYNLGYRGFETNLMNPNDEESAGWDVFADIIRLGCDATFSRDYEDEENILMLVDGRERYAASYSLESVEDAISKISDDHRNSQDFESLNSYVSQSGYSM